MASTSASLRSSSARVSSHLHDQVINRRATAPPRSRSNELIAFRKLADWDPARSSAASWLYAIAIRVAANHRRLAHVRRETPGQVPQVTVTPDPAGSGT